MIRCFGRVVADELNFLLHCGRQVWPSGLMEVSGIQIDTVYLDSLVAYDRSGTQNYLVVGLAAVAHVRYWLVIHAVGADDVGDRGTLVVRFHCGRRAEIAYRDANQSSCAFLVKVVGFVVVVAAAAAAVAVAVADSDSYANPVLASALANISFAVTHPRSQ